MAEFYFPWKQVSSDNSTSLTIISDGDGSGVSQLYFKISAPITLTLSGTARFYSNSSGTLDESTTFEATNTSSFTTVFVRCPSSTSTLTFSNRYNLLCAGNATTEYSGISFWTYDVYYVNSPILDCNNWNFPNCTIACFIGNKITGTLTISRFSNNMIKLLCSSSITLSGSLSDIGSYYQVFSSNTGTITGNLSSLPSSMVYFYVTGSNTITGDINSLSDSILTFTLLGNNTIYGDIGNLPINLTTLSVSGNNTISGNITNLPSTLVYISLSGSNTITGDITNFKSGMETILIYGNNTIYGDIGNLENTIYNFRVSGNNTISGDIGNLLSAVTSFYVIGSNTITGDIANMPYQMNYFYVSGNNTIYGDITNLPSTMTYFNVIGNNTISGDIANIPSAIYYFNVLGNNTISGSFNATTYSKTTITTFIVFGANTISGDLYYVPQNVRTFALGGNSVANTYTSGRTWPSSMMRFSYDSLYAGLDSTEVDNLLIDLAVGTWSTSGIISLQSGNAVRTSASDAAVATLISKSVDLSLNT